MQEAETERNSTKYKFVYLEKEKTIIVWKDDKMEYLIRVNSEAKKRIYCNCPGSIFHKHCFHEDFSKETFDFSRKVKPKNLWKQWQEEFLIMQLREKRK